MNRQIHQRVVEVAGVSKRIVQIIVKEQNTDSLPHLINQIKNM